MKHIALSLGFVLIIAVSYAGAQTCINGISCYPSDCSNQYRQCSGSTFYPAQACAAGTLCKAGQMVHTSDCPSSAASSSVSSTTTTSTSAKPASTSTTTSTSAKPASTTTTTSTSAKPASTTTTTSTSAQPASTSTSSTTTGSNSGSCSLSDIFSAADFSALFPNANGAAKRGDPQQYGIFNYSNLINAAKSFPSFACVGDVTTRKRELAAFLAQTSQESSAWWSGQPYVWGYFFSTELCLGANNCASPYYCSAGTYPCASGKIYCGRGPIQLSWNYNYALASSVIFGDSSVLVNNPDLVLSDGVVAYKTALWFWMTQQYAKPSCHDVMTGGWTPSSDDVNAGRLPGFGMVTNIVNGGIECQQPSTGSTNRIGYFEAYTSYFNIADGGNVACDKMLHY